jgi:uncharacterized protein (DUF58 family)
MRTKRVIGLIVVGCLVACVAVLGLLIAWLGSALGILLGLLIAVSVIGRYLQLRGKARAQRTAPSRGGDWVELSPASLGEGGEA